MNQPSLSLSEWRHASYLGTYTVDEGTKVVTLRVEASSIPNQLESDQKRTITSLTGTN
jgi:hypothetical protein